MIPRRAFWVFDLSVLIAAFATAYAFLSAPLFPSLGNYLEQFSGNRLAAVPSWVEALAPLPSLLILPFAGFSTLVVLDALSNSTPLVVQTRLQIVARCLVACLIASGIAAVVVSTDAVAPEGVFPATFGVISAAALAGYRLVFREYLSLRRAAGFYTRNVLLMGTPPALERMTRYFSEQVPREEYRVLGYFSLDESAPPRVPPDVKRLGKVEDLPQVLILVPIHEVLIIQSELTSDWLEQVITTCEYLRVVLRIIPEEQIPTDQRARAAHYSNPLHHLPFVVLTAPSRNAEALFVKRVIDIVLSAALLVLLSPLFLLIAVLIKLTTPRLSVLYPWRVVGQHGVEFTGYKFTTMVEDAEARQAELLDRNEMQGPVFKIKDDPRATRLGRILRKYSLNELPQLWSVLRGEMSLVGPRPAFRHELERYAFWHKRRLSVRPGITCLWQVRGRNRIHDFDDWARMDLEYIDRWSLWLDLKILARTVGVVVSGTGS